MTDAPPTLGHAAAPVSWQPSVRLAGGLLLAAGGVVALVWAFADPRFRDAEGFVDTAFCLPVGCAGALGLAAAGFIRRRGRYAAAAFWFALAMAGQSVALQMIHAGVNVSYQHYRTIPTLWAGGYRWHILLVAVQTLLVAWAARRWWSRAAHWVITRFGAWRLALIGLFVLGSSATKINVRVPVFFEEMLWASFLELLALVTVIAGCRALPGTDLSALAGWLDRLLTRGDAPDAREPRIDRFALAAAVWVTTAATTLGILAYERHPHVPDEVVYLQHARYLAAGRLTLDPPPVPEAFNMDLMELEPDRWYSPVPIGWPLVLAVGVFFGSPWMVNPILGGLIVLGGYWILTDLYARRRARIAVLLMCASPWFLFMSMNVMTHNATLAAAVGATIGVIKARRTHHARWAWLGGAALGFVALVRPVEGVCLAALLGLWSIGAGGRRLPTRAIVGLVLGSMIVAGTTLPYNRYLTGRATKFPIMAYIDKHYGPGKNSLGFGPEKGLGWRGVDPFPGHGPLDAMINNNLNAFSINVELLGWACGSVALIAAAVFGGGMVRPDRLMLAVIVAIVGIHVFYWYSGGPDFGARYWYLIFIPCIALTVSGADWIGRQLAASNLVTHADARVLVAMFALSMSALVAYIPWRAIDRYHHFRSMRPDVRRLSTEHHFGRSLVLIRGASRSDDYAAAFCYNPLDLESDAPIYAWDRPDKPDVLRQVVQHYHDRPMWIIDGPSMTGAGFRIAAGPLDADTVLSGAWRKQ